MGEEGGGREGEIKSKERGERNEYARGAGDEKVEN